jgi:hypothetical protein
MAALSRRSTCRNESGLSGIGVDADLAHFGSSGGLRRLDEQLQSLLEVGQRLFLGGPLARDIDVQTLGDEEVAFLVNDGAELALGGAARWPLSLPAGSGARGPAAARE